MSLTFNPISFALAHSVLSKSTDPKAKNNAAILAMLPNPVLALAMSSAIVSRGADATKRSRPTRVAVTTTQQANPDGQDAPNEPPNPDRVFELSNEICEAAKELRDQQRRIAESERIVESVMAATAGLQQEEEEPDHEAAVNAFREALRSVASCGNSEIPRNKQVVDTETVETS